VPLGEELARALGVPVLVENDVRAAAWGEFECRERARPERSPGRSLVAVFVGTGVGSGAIIEGVLWRGAGNAAGEVGHTQVLPGGRPCPCGQSGCLEQYAAGAGFQRQLADALEAGIDTVLARLTDGDPSRLTAAMVAEAAERGDPFAREVWRDAERYLTMAVANYVTLVNPHDLVLGGGVVEAVPRLFESVADGVLRLTTIMARASLRVDRARLGDWSGVVGAGLLAA
jgi:glucokinase